jgi:hypothetical protein
LLDLYKANQAVLLFGRSPIFPLVAFSPLKGNIKVAKEAVSG